MYFKIFIIIIIIIFLGSLLLDSFYIRRTKVPELNSKSKCISIMYLQKEIDKLEAKLDEEIENGSTTFCTEYDIERIKETIDFLNKF